MKQVEQHISPFIENMFPSFYKDEGPNFIAFVKAYYEWLEQSSQSLTLRSVTNFNVGDTITQTLDSGITVYGTITAVDPDTLTITVLPQTEERFRCITVCGVTHIVESSSGGSTYIQSSTPGSVLYLTRNLPNYRDIDTTIDRFILNFKEKYLKNIQFDIASNKKLLIKNSLDLYRSKGTERSIHLFFKLVYGVDTEVYYPGDDLFKLSDGEWYKPRYLEVTDTNKSIDYVGKQIVGTLSGSSAFVERYIRRRVKDAVVNILYVSNVVGEFNNNEPLGLETEALAENAPRVIGSLTDVQVVTGSRLFSVGDIVQFFSIKGDSGLARVASVNDTTGVVDFTLIDGGWGYTTAANVYVSEKVLEISNVVTSNTDYFDLFEYVRQPAANIVYTVANATFANDELVYSYYANNTVRGSGKIINVSQPEATNGEMYITIYSGTFPEGSNVYTTGNTKVANVADNTDKTARGFVVGVKTDATITVSSATSTMNAGIEIYQSNSTTEWANATVLTSTSASGVYTLNVQNAKGAFRAGTSVKVRGSSTTGTVDTVATSVGLSGITGAFSNVAGLYTYSENKSTNVVVKTVSGGTGATFEVGSLSESEDILTNTDMLGANNGEPPATDAYTDSFRRIMSVASVSGFTNNDIVYQDYDTVAFNPSTAVNTTSGFITLPNANSHYNESDTVKYLVDSGNTAINDLVSGEEYYVYTSNSTGVILARRYDNNAVNSTNFPSFANNVVSETGHYLTKIAYGLVTNTSVGLLTTSGAYNGFSITGGSPSTSTYANGNIVLYTSPTTNTAITAISTAAAINVSNQSYMSLPLMNYAYGFPKNIQGNIKDVIFSCLTIEQFTLGSIATLTGINPGVDYTVDPFVLVYQPYIPSFQRRDYIIELSGATSTFRTGEKIQQTPQALTYYLLTVGNTAPFSVGEGLYQGTVGSPTATMTVSDIFSATSMRVNNITGTIANTTLKSYSSASTTTISNNAEQQQYVTADAIVKTGSNTTVLYAKRIQFNNTFEVGQTITGLSSGTTATIADIYEDPEAVQIGLNANVQANVVTANGTITSLQVTDSGFGYSNSEILTYESQDGVNAGQAKAIVRGVGTGSGYYKGTKGFVSTDKYLIDSDYYQEYSYEIMSKLPFDKYAEMFKKVMHVAGTKVFGSVSLIESSNASITTADATSEKIQQFNSNTAIASSGIRFYNQRELKLFNSISDIVDNTDSIKVTQDPIAGPNIFANGDQVLYYTGTGGTPLGGLVNNSIYNVVGTTDDSIKLSLTPGGSPALIAPTVNYETHYLRRYDRGFANGNVVRYSTSTSNTAIQATIVDTFASNTGVSVDRFIVIANNLLQVGDQVNATFTATSVLKTVDSSNSLISNNYLPVSSHTFANGDRVLYYTGPGNTVFSGLANNELYYVIQANSSHVRLTTQQGNTSAVVGITGAYNNENGHKLLQGITGFTNAATYTVVQSNTSGVKLSSKSVPVFTAEFDWSTDISGANDSIAFQDANTHFANLDFVRYYTSKGVTTATGLANNGYYFVRYANSSVIKLSSTESGSLINLVSNANGTNGHFITNEYIIPYRSSNSGIQVTLTQTQLTNNGIYYCVNTVATAVQLARSANGTAINITANGTATGAATNGHYLTTHV